ncbi:hypothetical protein BDY19DRAFT_996346 [Irpex rosettiformis]|uniref:Uncharacterized protein n=1 Tax=Irpex rosettiformis TaxID=378272 RepID=A0ACB8TV25_9APHY|nr:hypothetical protein BDY19DRAFT_996346 [Irpex rosettiformis]
MARCRPVFPAPDPSPAPPVTLPSSLSTSATESQHNLIQRVAKAHAELEALPDELSPPSRSPSPVSLSRVALLRDKIAEAVAEAGSPANPSWARVPRILRMACTSRLYRGVPPGVRVGERVEAEVGKYKWVLPDTAEEWGRCEREWERRFLGTSKGDGQSSKYWAPENVEPHRSEEGAAERTPSKAELVRDKVRAWQASIVSTVESESANIPEVTDTASIKAADPSDNAQKEMKQSPISFPVAKPSVVAAGKRTEKLHQPLLSLHDKPLSSPPKPGAEPVVLVPSSNPDPVRIADMSEMSFLPPSFPPQLVTSTPDKTKVIKPRSKPSPILPLRPVESSPSSTPRLPNSTAGHILPPMPSSSSLPSTPLRSNKHSRPLTPDNSSIISPDEHLKKPRIELEESPIRQSSAQPPPSTPPPATSPRTPSPLIRRGLGNARGAPLPTTPNNKALPTLTELLASTRRSRPRPRPPSRKTKRATVFLNTKSAGRATTPNAEETREPSPAPTGASRAKTVFSSPASGSSDSPQSLSKRPRSPISPLFSHTFAPPFASTQQTGAGAGGFGGMGVSSQPHGIGLASGNGGMVGMGYNSQFDLEGQIGEVSDLLERDVDFDGWLRDIPEVDAEG